MSNALPANGSSGQSDEIVPPLDWRKLLPRDTATILKMIARIIITLLYVCIVLSISFPTRPFVAVMVVAAIAVLFTQLWFGPISWLRLLILAGVPFVILGAARMVAASVTRTSAAQEEFYDDSREIGGGPGAGGPIRLPAAGRDQVAPPRQPAGGPQPFSTLIVLVHGAGGPSSLAPIRKALRESSVQRVDLSALDARDEPPRVSVGADLLGVRYLDSIWSSFSDANPDEIADDIHVLIKKRYDPRRHARVVLIGHSMGALLARRAYLIGRQDAQNADDHWTKGVRRFVLLAGMNRGWSLSGQRPRDLGLVPYAGLWLGREIGDRTGTGRLARSMETGAPFVANLRLDWMRLARELGQQMPPTVQLLGDIDDFVSDADNTDLRVSGAGGFCWMRVRGTGHHDIVQVSAEERQLCDSEDERLAKYRFDKLFRVLTTAFDELRKEHDVQRLEEDPSVTRVVFVVHGIRDLGRWSADFEEALDAAGQAEQRTNTQIVSPRYGYFGMGPFLLPGKRERYVRWFMDEYTETLAAYPNLQRIDFFGHSNGTYLLAQGLDKYSSMRVNRIVFAGSVVRRDFDWRKLFERGGVKAVRNYVAGDDWVVALFPCFFECAPGRWLGNKLGSAGFNGFAPPGDVPGDVVYAQPGTQQKPISGKIISITDNDLTIEQAPGKNVSLTNASFLQNVGRIEGKHSAFLNHVGGIEKFLSGTNQVPGSMGPVIVSGHPVLQFISDWLIWFVWLVLAVLIGVTGYVLTMPSKTSKFIRSVLALPCLAKPKMIKRLFVWLPLKTGNFVVQKYAVTERFAGPEFRAFAVIAVFLWILHSI